MIFFKAHVREHQRRSASGRVVYVRDYHNSVPASLPRVQGSSKTGDGQMALFGPAAGDKKDPEHPARIAVPEQRSIQGVPVRIENPAGSIRSKTPRNGGKSWAITMQHDYGEIEGTLGKDGDPIDVYVGPEPESQQAYVVNQVDRDGKFNEHKVMLGFTDEDAARQGYLAHYPAGWSGLGSMAPMSTDQLKTWLRDGDKGIPAGDRDPRKRFYVTVVRNAGTAAPRVGYLAGPFEKHEDALSTVDAARREAERRDPWTAFDAFGTAAVTAEKHSPGKLNAALGI